MFKKIPIVLLCCVLGYHLFASPLEASKYVKQALILWYEKMIPALFPFMILSGFCIRYDLCRYLMTPFYPLLNKIYKITPDMCAALLMGTLFGFPIGAKMCAELYQFGHINRNQAQYLLSFTNNIGPIYMISFALPLMQIPVRIGILIHIGVPLVYGIFLRHTFYKKYDFSGLLSKSQTVTYGLANALDESIYSACNAITKLGGYMIFFLLCRLIFPSGFMSLILEITSGLSSCSGQFNPAVLFGMLSLGGLSCMAQTYTVIQGTDLSMYQYVIHKIIQSVLVTVMCCILHF